MSTLGGILDSLVGAGAGADQGGATTAVSDRQAYLDYQMACMENGSSKPLSYADWVKAGRPKG